MRAMESTRRKLETSEEKRFWRQAVLKKLASSEAPLQKLVTRSWRHQKHLKIIRSWRSSEAGRLKNFKCCSNEDWITPIIAEDWENKTMAISNGFEGIGCLFSWERWKRTFVRSVQSLSPLLCFLCLLVQEQQLCLQLCSPRLGMDLCLQLCSSSV